MFFPRLRRQAKWMFVLLALVFGVGFVVFGVGSGAGTGLGDVLNSIRGGSSGESESSLREQVQKNPGDASARKELATKLQQDGKTDQAIAVIQSYLALRPRDTAMISTLANLYLQKANGAGNTLRAVQRRLAFSNPGQGLLPAFQAKGQDVVPADPLGEVASQQDNDLYNKAVANLQGAYTHALTAYKRLVSIDPKNPQYQLQLGQQALTAAQIGVPGALEEAIAADKKYLKLAPDDPQAAEVKRQLKALRQTQRQVKGQ